jgi:hypothetical protein
MALTSYDELQAAVARTLRRTDLDADIPDFVTLAEARMNRRLRVRAMAQRASATLSQPYSAAPSDFLGVQTFTLEGDPPRVLHYLTPDQMEGQARGGAGTPQRFTVVGGELRFDPAPGAPVTGNLTYWARIPALSGSAPSNWVLERHPDAYLYGALAASAPFLRADDRLATWATLFLTALDDIEASDRSESFSGALTPVPVADF